jgi:hypothetical protein
VGFRGQMSEVGGQPVRSRRRSGEAQPQTTDYGPQTTDFNELSNRRGLWSVVRGPLSNERPTVCDRRKLDLIAASLGTQGLKLRCSAVFTRASKRGASRSQQ